VRGAAVADAANLVPVLPAFVARETLVLARRLASASFAAGLVALGCLAPHHAAARSPGSGTSSFRLVNGDRIVLLGGTLIEREQSHGYLEAALASRFPGADIQFRNLGRGGETLFGEARAGSGKPEGDFGELKKHLLAISPTMILLNYPANESVAGQAGLERFASGLEALLAALAKTGARMVLIGPPPQESPLADRAQRNRDLQLYSAAIGKLATARGAAFVDLFEPSGGKLQPPAGSPLTDNEVHSTAYGCWRLAPVVERALGLPSRVWQIEIDAARGNIAARGANVRNARFSPDAIHFVVHDRLLPLPPPPDDAPRESRLVAARMLRAFDLDAGTYVLKIDGRPVASGTARQWADGVNLIDGPEFEQAERLRQLVVQKNELFFARWRPPKTIELFGMRMQVPGPPVAVPPLDPLVAAREAAIRGLSKPLEHQYELARVADQP
jgi:hypothetical protein